jgi:hypothetical protein
VGCSILGSQKIKKYFGKGRNRKKFESPCFDQTFFIIYFIKPTAFPKLFLNEIDFRDLRDLVGRALDVEIHPAFLEWSEVPAEEFVRENYPD